MDAQRARAETGEQQAEQALGVANAHLLRVKIQKAREAFDAGRGNEGLAWLAAVLRQDPQNSFAPAWLLSALSDRNFPIPAGPRIAIPKTRAGTQGDQTRVVRYSPDGQQLLIANRAHGLAIWNPFTGQQVRLLHGSDIRDALWIPDGRCIASISFGSKQATVYDASTGKELGRTAPTHGALLAKVASSPDGSLLATGDDKCGVCVWNARTREHVATIPPFTRHPSDPAAFVEIHSLDFSADNRWLAIRASSPREAIVWDLRAGKAATPVLADINGAFRFHPTEPGRLLVPAFTKMNTWRVLDLAGGKEVTGQEFHTTNNLEGAFSPDGSRIASTGYDARARVWDARTGAALTPWLRTGGWVGAPQFSPEGLRFFAASGDMLCRLWDARSGELLAEPWGMPETALEVGQCRLSPDGAHAVLATRRRTVQAWDIREGRQLPMTVKAGGYIESIAWSPDGRLIAHAVSGGTPGNHARVWNAQTGEPAAPDLPHTGPVKKVAFSPDGQKLLTCSDDDTAMIWDVKTGKAVTGPLRHDHDVRATAWSGDGRIVATGCMDKTLRLWDAATGQPIGAPIPLRHYNVQGLAFSPDGALVAAATDGGTLLYDIRAAKPRAEVTRDLSHRAVTFSPDSSLAAIASEHGGVLMVKTGSGDEHCPPLPHPNLVQTVRFSRDGARLLSAGLDGTARLWDAQTGAPLVPPIRAGSPLLAAEWSPDGARVATAAHDGTVRLWDARTGQPLSEPMRHWSFAKSALFSPDGRRLAVFFSERVALWEVPPAPGPAPAWLPALAEAVAGRRIDEQGELTGAGVTDFWFSRDRLLARAGSADHYERWAAWFVADRATRSISPWSKTTVPDAVKKLRTFAGTADRDQVLRYQPLDSTTMLRQGYALRDGASSSPADRANGEYLLALATLRPPFESEIQAQRAAGNAAYTQHAGPRGFPARDPAATARQIDLTERYNMILDAAFTGGDPRFHLGMLPKGVQTFDGVTWDVRGLIAVYGAKLPPERLYPYNVTGIRIAQRARTLHILHGCGWSPPGGTKVGRYVLHYADGETRDLPIVFGEDLHNWGAGRGVTNETKNAREAWRAPSGEGDLRLFHRPYENPRPDAEIATLELVSEKTDGAPFVVAITLE